MTKASNSNDNEINLQNSNNNEHLPDLSLKSLNLNDNTDKKTNNPTSQRNPNKSSTTTTTAASYFNNTKSYNRNRQTRHPTSYQKTDTNNNNKNYYSSYHQNTTSSSSTKQQQQPTLDLTGINSESFNIEKELNLEKDKFFVIKSFSAQDVYNSVIYKIWCSTENGNVKLNDAYKEANEVNGNVYLFFSVNGSGYFCGVAKMTSEVDFTWQPDPNLWSHSTKWKGKFNIKWLYVKNVPNRQLSYIKLENNENKPVTHSRDCQLVPSVNGVHVLKIVHYYHHYSSILDYSDDYE